MNHTPLEDQVHDALHRTADPLERNPFTVGDVRTRARRIQHRRAAVAGAAVAAMAAVAVPIGLGMVGPAQRSEVPPVTQPPSPSVTAAGTVRIDPRSADVVESTSVPLLDVAAPALVTGGETLPLPRPYDQLTPYLDGWAAVANDEGTLTLELLASDFKVEDAVGPTGGLVVSPDREQIAWSEYDGSRWRVAVAPVASGATPRYASLAPGPQDAVVTPVGFVSDTEVVLARNDGAGTITALITDQGAPRGLSGLTQPVTSSPVTGLIGGVTSSDVEGSCYAVVDAAGETAWESCAHALTAFSPDGRHVVGLDPTGNEYGSPTLAVLDAGSGETVVDFEVVQLRRQVGGINSQVVWEDAETLLVTMLSAGQQFVVRLGLDGTVQRVGDPGTGADPFDMVWKPAEVR